MSELAFPAMVEVRSRKTRPLEQLENGLLLIVLLLMIAVPIAEIVLRKLRGTGISGASVIVQHGTLAVGMIGAAIAARERRLLSLATSSLLHGRWAAVARIVAGSIGAAVSALLAIASARFVLTERLDERTLAYGVPTWVIQAILPIGFGLIALRLIMAASNQWSSRLITSAATLVMLLVSQSEISSHSMILAGFAVVFVAAVLGAPIFAVLGGAAIVSYWSAQIPLAAMAVSHYSLAVNPSLPAIPLFTLAGYILAEGGASGRLVRVFRTLVGGVRGGPAIVTVLACAFFTTFTGGSGVTILALGGLLLPILLEARYSERDALGLLTGAGALGILFPPCLPLILYGIAAGLEMSQLFLAGIVPGFLLLVLSGWLGRSQQPRGSNDVRFNAGDAARAVWAAKWELFLPVVALAPLLTGIATAVETAAVTALYALFIETVIYRDYRSPSKLASVFVDSGLLVGGILLILGVSLGLTGYLVDAEIPQLAVEWVTANIESKLVFLLLLNLFLIVVGALMDVYSAIVVVVPLILPLGVAFGIDPIHLGIIFLANLELGFLVPPVGENLFISAYRFNKPLGELARAVLPFVFVLLLGVLAITYVPFLTLALPKFLK